MAQQHFADEVYKYPLVPSTETNPLLTPLGELETPDIDLLNLEGTLLVLQEVGAL